MASELSRLIDDELVKFERRPSIEEKKTKRRSFEIKVRRQSVSKAATPETETRECEYVVSICWRSLAGGITNGAPDWDFILPRKMATLAMLCRARLRDRTTGSADKHGAGGSGGRGSEWDTQCWLLPSSLSSSTYMLIVEQQNQVNMRRSSICFRREGEGTSMLLLLSTAHCCQSKRAVYLPSTALFPHIEEHDTLPFPASLWQEFICQLHHQSAARAFCHNQDTEVHCAPLSLARFPGRSPYCEQQAGVNHRLTES